jgi:hypothetical protein
MKDLSAYLIEKMTKLTGIIKPPSYITGSWSLDESSLKGTVKPTVGFDSKENTTIYNCILEKYRYCKGNYSTIQIHSIQYTPFPKSEVEINGVKTFNLRSKTKFKKDGNLSILSDDTLKDELLSTLFRHYRESIVSLDSWI